MSPWLGEAQSRHRRTVAATITAFVSMHRPCLGEFDILTSIPSQKRTALFSAIELIIGLRDTYQTVLTPTAPKGRTPSQRFTALNSVAGKRVLLIDDTLASGSTLFAACHALTAAGANIVGPLIVGRLLQPEWSGQLISNLAQHEWTLDLCSRCHPLILSDTPTLL